MNVFVSVLTYELGRQLGVVEATEEFRRQVANPMDPVNLPAARVVARLLELGDAMLCHPAGTHLPKVRSRTAHAARKWLTERGGGIWVMVDDDVECDPPTLGRLIAAAGDSRVAVLPCPVRGNEREIATVNCVWDSELLLPIGGVLTRAVRRGGCGMMVVPLRALDRVSDEFQGQAYIDADGERKIALFLDVLKYEGDTDRHVVGLSGELGAAPRWLGEDYSFCERLREAGVPIVAPVEGFSVHAGIGLDLKLCQR